MKKDERGCQNCRYFSGWDGGFFGLSVTTDCRHFGVTENRKNCKKFKRPYPRGYALLVAFLEWYNKEKEDVIITLDDLSKFQKEWK